MAASKKLSEAALRVLGALDITKTSQGTTLRITGGQLERKLYEEVNNALVALGGKWNRSAKGHVFTESIDDALEAIITTGAFVDAKKLTQFYATPDSLANAVVKAAQIREGMAVLEPSAGDGSLVRAIDRAAFREVCTTMVELDKKRAGLLMDNCVGRRDRAIQGDFLNLPPHIRETLGTFDRVIMNPPFTQQQDAKHVLAAYELLKPGGFLVAIMSAAVKFRQTKLYDQVRALFPVITDNPPGSFKAAGTSVNTVMVVISKV